LLAIEVKVLAFLGSKARRKAVYLYQTIGQSA